MPAKLSMNLAECGFDFLNPFDPEEGFALERVLRTYADRFVVVGGFPASFWDWDAEQQGAHLSRIGELGCQYGRFIFMDSGGVPDSVCRSGFERVLQTSRIVRRVDTVEGAV